MRSATSPGLPAVVILLSMLAPAAATAAGSRHPLPPIVFVSRNPLPGALPGDLPGFGPEYRTAVVGGKLMIRQVNGSVRALVDSSKLVDVADPCVFWDGTRVVFSGVQHADSSWRIYEIRTDGTGFRQLTFSDRSLNLSQFGTSASIFSRYDDFDPCYLPGGGIVLASTRYPSLAMVGRVRVSNLYVMDRDGHGLHRITSERNGGEEPTIDPVTGRIVYTRWWANADRPSNSTRNNLSRENSTSLTDDIGNLWHAAAINPDGDALKMYAGFVRTRPGTQTYKPSVMRDGRLLSTFSPRMSLVPTSGGTGVRWFKPGADVEHHVVGLRPDVQSTVAEAGAPPFASDPVELSSRLILISYSPDGKEYGIYSCTLDGGELQKIIDLPGTLELEPQVAAPRPVPPVVAVQFNSPVSDLPPTEDPETYGRNDLFRFDCMNIFWNGKVDEPMPDAPRIGKNLRIQFFLNSQRQSIDRPDPSILVKTVPVMSNGGVHEPEVPAEVPLFEQIIDSTGKVVGTPDGRWAHVAGFNFERMGSGTKCVGCHIGHSMLEVPVNGAVAEWINVSPSAEATASSVFQDKEGVVYSAGKAIDRQARLGGDTVIWVANEKNGAWLDLHWPVPVEVKQFVLYNIPPKKSHGTTILVQKCKIVLYYKGVETGSILSDKPLSPNGTKIPVRPAKIDAARITITEFSGTFKRKAVAGLAEVETIARLY